MSRLNIIVNLGAPSDTDVKAASDFIREFLSDPCVISLPYLLRKFIAYKAAQNRGQIYSALIEKILVDNKHPLLHYTESLARKISAKTGNMTVTAYRYGERNIEQVVDSAREYGVNEFFFIPLYPQNAYSTTTSVQREVNRIIKRRERKSVLTSYCDHPLYIKALAESLRPLLEKSDAVMASFHSVPLEHTKKTPYLKECKKTVELLKAELGVENIEIAWQSKAGKGKWLEPSATDVVRKLAKDGKKHIAAICPGFSCDCSETVMEIGMSLRESFINAGGRNLFLAPCLNDSEAHVNLLTQLFKEMK